MISRDKKKIIIIIPARLESKRLPNKVLKIIDGEPMIVKVAKKSKNLNIGDVIVASGNKEICKVLNKFKIRNVLTTKNHKSGTDRIYEAFKKIYEDGNELIINIQGDLPYFSDSLVFSIIELMKNKNVDIGSAVCSLQKNELHDSNVVKAEAVFENKFGYATNFWRKADHCKNLYHHIGIYAFRPNSLKKFVNLKQTQEEISKGLEQMRALDNNMKIGLVKVSNNPISVDSIDDLKKIRLLLEKKLIN